VRFELDRPGFYFRGRLEVYLDPSRLPEIVAGSLDGDSPAELARELGRVARQRPELLCPVLDGRLTAHAEDLIPDAGWSWIGEALAGRLGYGACPWVAIRHPETGRDHLHLVASRVRFDGTRVPARFERVRMRQIAADFERELDLHHDLSMLGRAARSTRRRHA
jgi:hypothetical protein